MSEVTNVPFEVVMSFKLPSGDLGVVLRKVTEPALHYVLQADNVFGAKPVGAMFNVECKTRGDAIQVPENLNQAWTGAIGNAAEQIQRLYLANLYNAALNKSLALTEQLTGRYPGKSFDPIDVFATPILALYEALYNTMFATEKDGVATNTLREKLAADEFKFIRRAVYTRFDGDGPDVSYATPRILRYFPEQRTVSVTFTLEEPKDEKNAPLPDALMAKFRGNTVQLNHFYVNEGWISLRELMKKDERVNRLVRQYAADGWIKPVDRTNAAK